MSGPHGASRQAWLYFIGGIVAALLIPGGQSWTGIGCVEEPADIPLFSVTSLKTDVLAMTVEECVSGCLVEAYAYAGITENMTCTCSSDPSIATTPLPAPVETCDLMCIDTEQCGGPLARTMYLYETGGGSANFTLDSVVHTIGTDLQVTMTPIEPVMVWFYVDVGTRAGQIQVNSTAVPLITQPYLIPGNYTVTVTGTLPAVSGGMSLTDVVVVPGTSTVDLVHCPIVAEPDVQYNCNVSVTLGESIHTFNGEFASADQTLLLTFGGVGSSLVRVGQPVPLGFAPAVLPSNETLTTVVTFTQMTISTPSMLYAVEFYAMETGTYAWQIERPTCAVGSYCVYAGGCLDPCPYDSLNRMFTCAAPSLFCTSKKNCDTAGTCTAPGTAPTWAIATSGSVAAVGHSGERDTLATPFELLPGDTLKITGNLALSGDTSSPGDTVDGVLTSSHRLANMVIKELMPLALGHTCLVINNDVTLTVTDNPTSTSFLSNITACQRNITDVLLHVIDAYVDAHDYTLNLDDPYYIWAGALYTHTFMANFTVGGPTNFTVHYEPDIGANVTHIDPLDYPFTAGVIHNSLFSFSIPTDGMYLATVTAENLHNLFYLPPTHTITIYALYPVLPQWVMSTVRTDFMYFVPDMLPDFQFVDTLAGTPPSNASVLIDWLDLTVPEVLPFAAPFTFTHVFPQHGIYLPEASIYNLVSSYNVSCTVTIIQRITDFEIINGYYSSLTSTERRPGMGKLLNQYPMDKNLTFVPKTTNGTITRFEVKHTINNSFIFDFTPTDMFNPLADEFRYHFDYECDLNITVCAFNQFHSECVDLVLEIVGQVRVLQINDYSITSKHGDSKLFEFTYESIGGGTCMIISWGDGSPLEAFGEEDTCKKNFSHAIYNPNIALDMAMNMTHVYNEPFPGCVHWTYNISAFAYNPMSETQDMFMFPITNLDCHVPQVYIVDQVLDYLNAEVIYKGDVNAYLAVGKVNCSLSRVTKKRWQIFEVDEENGRLSFPVYVMNIISSWNKPELVIPKAFLPYGYYMLLYTLTMDGGNPSVFPPELVFQAQTQHYLEVAKSPIIGKMVANAISKVTRGLAQSILLEPAVYSEDPDFPDVKNFSITWKCREISETYPSGETPSDMAPLGAGAGCFGNGIGLLTYSEREMEIFGSDFIGVGSYEILATVRKDTRVDDAIIHIDVVLENVPLVEVTCLTPTLCVPHPTSNGVIVNPTNRLVVGAECIDQCFGDMTTVWTAVDINGQQLVVPGDINADELALEVASFFELNPNLQNFYLTATVTNGLGLVGTSTYYMIVNKPPIAPYHDPNLVPVPTALPNKECIIYPDSGKAIIDTFYLMCNSWTDPDNIGITDYRVELLYPPDTTPVVHLTHSHSSSGQQYMELVFGPDTFDLQVVVTDDWRGTTTHKAAAGFTVDMLTEEEFNSLNLDHLIASLAGAGDSAMLTQVIAAQTKIVSQAPWLDLNDPTLSPEELAARQAKIGNMFQNSLQYLNDTTNFDDFGKAQAAAAATAAIMDFSSKSTKNSMCIGLESRGLVADIMEQVADSAEGTPIDDMNAMDSLMTAVETMAAGIALNIDDIISQEGCDMVPPVDMAIANDLVYNTEVTGINMVVPATLEAAQKCNIVDHTKDSATSIMDRATKVVEELCEKIMDRMMVGDHKKIDSPNGMTVGMSIIDGFSLEGWYQCGLCTYYFPIGFCPQGLGKCHVPVGVMCKEWPAINYRAPSSADLLANGSYVLDLDIYWRDNTKIEVNNTEDAMYIGIYRTSGRRGNSTIEDLVYINATCEVENQLLPVMYSKFELVEKIASVTVEMRVPSSGASLFFILGKGFMPTLKKYDLYKQVQFFEYISGTNIQEFFLESKKGFGPGTYYLGVGEFADGVTAAQKKQRPTNFKYADMKKITVDYEMRVFSSACYYRNVELNDWVHGGMQVVTSNYTYTICETHHLTSFGAGFDLKPNEIDFSFIFANMGFEDNYTIYIALALCTLFFILFLIWARFKDRDDERQVGVAPLPDNNIIDKYLYELIVFTGDKKEAQTDSVVNFVLGGELGESDVRTFEDPKRIIFRRSGVDAFLMANDRPLGPLHYMRIWHDSSGKGPNASWFLSYIVVRDVQTGEKFEFLCHDWMAVEKEGSIDRSLQVAREDDKLAFGHLYKNVSAKSIIENHLWVSIFCRSRRSRFTRMQRVGTCWAILYLSMLVNVMFYNLSSDSRYSEGFLIGPMNLTKQQSGVGLLCDFLVFFPTLLIVFLFKFSRPRVLRESRIDLALEEMERVHEEKKAQNLITPEEEEEQRKELKEREEGIRSGKTIVIEKKVERKKKFILPWVCAYVGWILVIVCAVASAFFLLMYGVMFGQSRAMKWVTSMLVSIFVSVLILQPLKIFFITFFFSVMCKKKTTDMDEANVEDDEKPMKHKCETVWYYDGNNTRKHKLVHEKADPEEVARLGRLRRNQKEMHDILQELAVYAVFVFVLMTLAYNHRDSNAWYLRENLRHSLIHEGLIDGSDWTTVTDANAFWYYMNYCFFGFLRADVLYNGKPPYQLRGFLNDQQNRIMGYATMRQIRAKKFTCQVPKEMRGIVVSCSGFSQLVNEEDNHFCAGWNPPNNETKNTVKCRSSEFRYSTAEELDSLPLWGPRDWYGGGGYVVHLKANTVLCLKLFNYLQQNHWTDEMTRAVLIEFSTYNVGVNLFGVTTLIAEFMPGGGIQPYYRVDAVQLMQHHSDSYLYVILIEVCFVLFTVYFTLKELYLLYKKRGSYLDSYWTYAELGMIVACYASIILYAFRHFEVQKALKTFSQTFGNGYIRLTYAITLNEYYSYTLSFMVFVAMLKFMKMLRFNKRIGILSATLRKCWDELSSFLIAFFLCFFSFVFLFYCLLNDKLQDFYHFVVAIETSFSMMLGKFEFNEMRSANALVPLLFFIFVLCNSWVLINLLLTLIITSFQEVKHDMERQPDEYKMMAFIWGSFKSAVGYGPKPRLMPLKTTKKCEETDNNVSKEEQQLRQFPDKIDSFLEYINSTYFDGKMNIRDKSHLKTQMKQVGEKGYFNTKRRIYSTD